MLDHLLNQRRLRKSEKKIIGEWHFHNYAI